MEIRFTLSHMDAHAEHETRYCEFYDLSRAYDGIKDGSYWSENDCMAFLLETPLWYTKDESGSHVYRGDALRYSINHKRAEPAFPFNWELVPFSFGIERVVMPTRHTALLDEESSFRAIIREANLCGAGYESELYCSLRGVEFDISSCLLPAISNRLLWLELKHKLHALSNGNSMLKDVSKAVKQYKASLQAIIW